MRDSTLDFEGFQRETEKRVTRLERRNNAAMLERIRKAAQEILSGDQPFDKIRLPDTTWLTLTSTEHPLQIGPDESQNVRLDHAGVQAVNDGAASQLDLNPLGGSVMLGNHNSDVNVAGRLRLSNTADASETSTGQAFQIGADNAPNLAIDNNEVIARDGAGNFATTWIGQPGIIAGSERRFAAAVPTRSDVNYDYAPTAPSFLNMSDASATVDGIYKVWGNGTALGYPSAYGFVRIYRANTDGRVDFYQQNAGIHWSFAWNVSTTSISWDMDPVFQSAVLSGTPNLNNYNVPGEYHCHHNAVASAGSNFPVAAAGRLRVGANEVNSNFLYQEYLAYQAYGGSHLYARGRYNGTWSAWERVGAGLYAGLVTISGMTQGTTHSISVSFPGNRFQSAPAVNVTSNSTAPVSVLVAVSGVSATGCSIYGRRSDTVTSMPIHFMAADRSIST